jgi:hypothetical protein
MFANLSKCDSINSVLAARHSTGAFLAGHRRVRDNTVRLGLVLLWRCHEPLRETGYVATITMTRLKKPPSKKLRCR